MKLEAISSADAPVAQLPGGVATRTAFVPFEGATTEQLCSALRQVTKMDGALAWWLGDIGIELQERKRRDLAAEARRLRSEAAAIDVAEPEARPRRQKLLKDAEELETNGVIRYTDDVAEAQGVDKGYWNNCVMLARFYEPSSRGEGLKPKHYRVALTAVGGVKGDRKKAQEWLERARSEHWEPSDLRKQVNVTLATARPPTTPPEVDLYAALHVAERWALAHGNDKLTPDQRLFLIERFPALIGFVEKLRSLG